MVATMLLVEDHHVLRWSLHTWLEFAFPDCRIIDANNEEQATRLALTHLPEVIIVDTHMADGGAFSSVKRLKDAVPISWLVVMSDYDDAAHRAHALDSGANAYVYKRALLAQLQPMLTNQLHPNRESTAPEHTEQCML